MALYLNRSATGEPGTTRTASSPPFIDATPRLAGNSETHSTWTGMPPASDRITAATCGSRRAEHERPVERSTYATRTRTVQC